MRLRISSLLGFLLVLPYCLFAQAPPLQWQRSLGGSNSESAQSIQPTSDGGSIVTGQTRSSDGDVSGLHGTDSPDAWVAKLSSTGALQWQRCYGGTMGETFTNVQQTSDGGYILAGSTQSNDGDVVGKLPSFGTDVWIVKINSTGSIQWQRCLGGSQYEDATDIKLTADGGFIVACETFSNDGDVSGLHGGPIAGYDFWIVKLSSAGNIEWQRTFGGSSNDIPSSIQQTSDNGYIVAGFTISTDGDVIGKHAFSDYWVIKLSSFGTLQWQRCLGGSGYDNATSVQQATDGGYIVLGSAESTDNDVSGNHGLADYWVVKLGSGGTIQWQHCYGGSKNERAYSVKTTSDGGYILAGLTSSSDGDVSGRVATLGNDYWLVKITNSGALDWQGCYGGSTLSSSVARSIYSTPDGGYMVGGTSYNSNGGNVSGNHGLDDIWVVKLTGPVPDLTPVMIARPLTITGTANIDIAINVVGVSPFSSNGLLTLFVSKDPLVRLSFDGLSTSSNGQSVQNSVWSFSDTVNPIFYVLTTNQIIPPGSVLSVGLKGLISPGNTKGSLSLSSIVVGGNNGEVKVNNNSDAEKIDYFAQ